MDVGKELFTPLEHAFAQAFCPQEGAKERLLLCYLLAMSRLGHLCVKMEQEHVQPSPLLLTSDLFLSRQIEKELFSLKETLTSDLCQTVSLEKESYSLTPIYRYGDSFYLQKNWQWENRFFMHLQRLMQAPLQLDLPPPLLEKTNVNALQFEAACKALQYPVSLISGGPGTGKSFTAVEIIRLFLTSLPSRSADRVLIKVAAPTGKAAALLEKRILIEIGPLAQRIQCGTLHSLLCLRSRESLHPRDFTLFADLLLVDEASMIDAKLFSLLLSSLRAGGRLVLMGDKDQLPPVESGGFFSDLVELAPFFSLPATILKKSLRVERKELLGLAEAVLLGTLPDNPWTFLIHHPEEVVQKVWAKCQESFSFPVHDSFDPKEALHALEQFRVLSCMRKGPLGVDALNRKVLDRFLNRLSLEQRWAVPILIVKNDYPSGLMNGETGLLVAKVSSLKKGRFDLEDGAYFWDKEQEGILRYFSAAELPSFELGYCLSVHKSQGSEYDSLILVVPAGSESFGRQVLYTAMTRAKKDLLILAEEAPLSALLKQSSRKISGLKERALDLTKNTL